MKVLILLFGLTQIQAQSLQILPAPPSGTMEGSFQIMIVSPAGKSLSAIQWRISISGDLTVSGERITAGSAAETVQKVITCAAVKGQDNPRSGYVCILVGGTQPIPNGPVAVVRFTARASTPDVTIRVSDILGATPKGTAVRIADVEATMELREVRVK
jgi:hypothetical protein